MDGRPARYFQLLPQSAPVQGSNAHVARYQSQRLTAPFGRRFRFVGYHVERLASRVIEERVKNNILADLKELRKEYLAIQPYHIAHLKYEQKNHFYLQLVQYYRRCAAELNSEIAKLRITYRGLDLTVVEVNEELQLELVLQQAKANSMETYLARNKVCYQLLADKRTRELYKRRQTIGSELQAQKAAMQQLVRLIDAAASDNSALRASALRESRRRDSLAGALSDVRQYLRAVTDAHLAYTRANFAQRISDTQTCVKACDSKLDMLDGLADNMRQDFSAINADFATVHRDFYDSRIPRLLESAGNAFVALWTQYCEAVDRGVFQRNLIQNAETVKNHLDERISYLRYSVLDRERELQLIKSSSAETQRRLDELHTLISAADARTNEVQVLAQQLDAHRARGAELRKQLSRMERLVRVI